MRASVGVSALTGNGGTSQAAARSPTVESWTTEHRSASSSPPGGHGSPPAAAGIIIGVLALAVAVLALRDATSRAPLATRTQRPAAIEVLIASTVSFPLTETPGALLQVQYLRAGAEPAAIWATLAARGLPQDTSYYTATAGDCVNGHPRILASASLLPDP